MRVLLAGLTAVAATSALADFDMDIDAATARAAAKQFVVGDLEVGEIGRLGMAAPCRDGHGLYVWAMTPLAEYKSGFRVRREPEGRVSLTVQPDTKTPLKQFLMTVIAEAQECSIYQPYGPDRLQVISIDGMTSASEILTLPD